MIIVYLYQGVMRKIDAMGGVFGRKIKIDAIETVCGRNNFPKR